MSGEAFFFQSFNSVTFKQKVRFFALNVIFVFSASLVSAGPILTPLEEPEEPIQLERKYDELGLFTPGGFVPALWHTEITGADLAKKFLRGKTIGFHDVVIIDSRAERHTYGKIETAERPVRKITRRELLLSSDRPLLSGAIFFVDGLLGEERGLSRFYGDLDEEVIDPREFQIMEPGVHGEHVSGIVGAGDFPFGSSSVARVHSVDIFQHPDYTFYEDHLRTLSSLRARDWEPTTFSLSITFGAMEPLIDGYNDLFSKENVIGVLAAANDRRYLSPMSMQSQLHEAILVGSFSPTGMLSGFSNYGPALDFVAPGEGVLSFGDQFDVEGEMLSSLKGTSMATPQVSGTIANLRALLPDASKDEVYEILRATSWDLQIPGHDEMTGHGLINTLKATRVAHRLAEGVRDNEDPYDFEAASVAAAVRALQGDVFSAESMEANRESTLLSQDIESFLVLSVFYSMAFPCFGEGLKLMVYNRPQMRAKDETSLAARMEIVRHVQRHARAYYGDLAPALRNLANAELILESYDSLPLHPKVDAILTHRMALLEDDEGLDMLLALQEEKEEEQLRLQLLPSGRLATGHNEL